VQVEGSGLIAKLDPLKMRFAFVPEDLDPDDYKARFGKEGPGSSELDTMRSMGSPDKQTQQQRQQLPTSTPPSLL
jgi:hypothetical protein